MSDQEAEPRSYAYLPKQLRQPDQGQFSLRLLEDDIRYALQPSLAKNGATISVQSTNIARDAVYRCFNRTQHQHSAVRDLESFIELTGIELLLEGRRAVELVVGENTFFVSGLYPGSWSLNGGTLVQTIEEGDALPGRPREVQLGSSDFYVFEDEVLRPEFVVALRRRLSILDTSLRLNLRPDSPGVDRKQLQFDHGIAMLNVTKPLGWPPRPRPKGFVDPYYAYRVLKFRRFAASLRDSIVRGMNDVIQRVGKLQGFSASISIVGMRSPDDFDEIIDALVSGRVGPAIIKDCW